MNLYNKERPLQFKDVVGQDKVITQLRGLLVSSHMPTAFLFIGPRGTGKTTVARIVARSINCDATNKAEPCNTCKTCRSIMAGENIDVQELDAASNNKVEDIRELIQSTQYAAVGKRKVYILDEVHMLSQGAFNALLKTLEEPPEGCCFILCTTEEHKVPATIMSRCSRFYFERMEMSVITNHLATICDKYNVAYELDGLKLIARAAEGCMRDALSILEPSMLNECLSTQMIRGHLGLMEEDAVFDILQGIIKGSATDAVGAFHKIVKKGISVATLLKEIMSACCDIVYVLQSGTIENIINTECYIQNVKLTAETSSAEEILHIAAGLAGVYSISSQYGNMDFFVEMEILKLIASESSYQVLEKRVVLLEEQISALKKTALTSLQESTTMIWPEKSAEQFDETQTSVMKSRHGIAISEETTTQHAYPDTEEFYAEEILPGDSSSLKHDSPNPKINRQAYESVLDDGSKIVGSINLFRTSEQEKDNQPATDSSEDFLDLGMFAGFVRP